MRYTVTKRQEKATRPNTVIGLEHYYVLYMFCGPPDLVRFSYTHRNFVKVNELG